jgi:hypothetical protein
LSTASASWLSWCAGLTSASCLLNEYYEVDGKIIFTHACKLGCEGMVEATRLALSVRTLATLGEGQESKSAGDR